MYIHFLLRRIRQRNLMPFVPFHARQLARSSTPNKDLLREISEYTLCYLPAPTRRKASVASLGVHEPSLPFISWIRLILVPQPAISSLSRPLCHQCIRLPPRPFPSPNWPLVIAPASNAATSREYWRIVPRPRMGGAHQFFPSRLGRDTIYGVPHSSAARAPGRQ